MAINERLIHTASDATDESGNQQEGLILHLDANSAKQQTHCSRICRKAPSPRPTLFNSCVDGCKTAHQQYAACEEKKIEIANAQTEAGANAATGTAEMFTDDNDSDSSEGGSSMCSASPSPLASRGRGA